MNIYTPKEALQSITGEGPLLFIAYDSMRRQMAQYQPKMKFAVILQLPFINFFFHRSIVLKLIFQSFHAKKDDKNETIPVKKLYLLSIVKMCALAQNCVSESRKWLTKKQNSLATTTPTVCLSSFTSFISIFKMRHCSFIYS